MKWEKAQENKEIEIESKIQSLIEGSKEVEEYIKKVVSLIIANISKNGKLNNILSNYGYVDKEFINMLHEIKNSKFRKRIDFYTKAFSSIVKYNGMIQIDLNDLEININKTQPYIKRTADLVYNNLLESGLEVEVMEPIRKIIYANLAAGASLDFAMDTLSSYISSNKSNNSLFRRHVTRIARDTVYQVDGAINANIANLYDLNAYKYVGSLVKDSRAQCVRWKSIDIIPVSALQSEINWAMRQKDGMINGTTPDNFAINRGGYNCRHSAIPIRLTDEEIEAAINKISIINKNAKR